MSPDVATCPPKTQNCPTLRNTEIKEARVEHFLTEKTPYPSSFLGIPANVEGTQDCNFIPTIPKNWKGEISIYEAKTTLIAKQICLVCERKKSQIITIYEGRCKNPEKFAYTPNAVGCKMIGQN